MKRIASFLAVMIMGLALVSSVAAAPAYTDFTDSKDIPHQAVASDLQTPNAIGW